MESLMGSLIGTGIAFLALYACSHGHQIRQEEFFFVLFALVNGVAWGAWIGRGESRTETPGPWFRRMFYAGAGTYIFLWAFVMPLGEETVFDRWWFAGLVMGLTLALAGDSPTKFFKNPSVLGAAIMGPKVMLTAVMSGYLLWLVCLRPDWLIVVHRHCFGYSEYYQTCARVVDYALGWHAVTMLIVTVVSIIDNFFFSFPKEDARRVE